MPRRWGASLGPPTSLNLNLATNNWAHYFDVIQINVYIIILYLGKVALLVLNIMSRKVHTKKIQILSHYVKFMSTCLRVILTWDKKYVWK